MYLSIYEMDIPSPSTGYMKDNPTRLKWPWPRPLSFVSSHIYIVILSSTLYVQYIQKNFQDEQNKPTNECSDPMFPSLKLLARVICTVYTEKLQISIKKIKNYPQP